MDSSEKKKKVAQKTGNDSRMDRDVQFQVGNGIPLSTASRLVLVRPYLRIMMIIPFDSDSRFGFVVGGSCVVDVFDELEISDSNQGYDPDSVAVAVVVAWRIAPLGLLMKMCLYPH